MTSFESVRSKSGSSAGFAKVDALSEFTAASTEPAVGKINVVHSDEAFATLRTYCAEHERYLVVDFSAEWCGPCKKIFPAYAQLSKDSAQDESTRSLFVFAKVDIDECPATTSQYGVDCMPTFQVHWKGVRRSGFSGADGTRLKKMLYDVHAEHVTAAAATALIRSSSGARVATGNGSAVASESDSHSATAAVATQ